MSVRLPVEHLMSDAVSGLADLLGLQRHGLPRRFRAVVGAPD
jgi:hypothetical protein